LVLDFVAFRRTIWVVVTESAADEDVFTVTWSICDVESLFDTAISPAEAQCFIEAALDILWLVSAPSSVLLLNALFDRFDVFAEVEHFEAICTIRDVSISDKSNANLQAGVVGLDGLDYLNESVLGALNPGAH